MFLSTPPNTLDVSFRVPRAESSYMVYASTETMQCFECGDIGHKLVEVYSVEQINAFLDETKGKKVEIGNFFPDLDTFVLSAMKVRL